MMVKLETLIGPLCAIPPGEGRNFEVDNVRIAVFHTRAGEVFAVQAECPHKGGPLADGLLADGLLADGLLADGTLGGSLVICPLHSWKFDLSTGAAVSGDCGLKTYPVRMDDADRIFITT